MLNNKITVKLAYNRCKCNMIYKILTCLGLFFTIFLYIKKIKRIIYEECLEI